MLIENVGAEMALLLFTLLVPMGVSALALMGCVRGFAPAAETAEGPDRKIDKLASIPAVVMIVGLICSFFHLGHPSTVFFMLTGVGTSPLSNEILVAAIAIVVGVVYWVLCLVKVLPRNGHRAFGIVLAVLALLCAVFTGIAYSIATIPTWDTPFNWLGQIGLALLGGSALAAMTFALSNHPLDRKVSGALLACGLVGCLCAVITLIGQVAVVAPALGSAGATLASTATDYALLACLSIVCMVVAVVLWAVAVFSAKAEHKTLMVVAFIAALIGLALLRACFYGIYLSAGLAYL